MSHQARVSHPAYGLLPTDVEGFDALAELTLDMRWSWNHATDDVWQQLDGAEADALYELLEREVVPEFYSRDASGIPSAWIKRMRESMAQLTPRFSTNRTVREYTEQRYLPAASAYRTRAADNGAAGENIVRWKSALRDKWRTLRFGEVQVETRGEQQVFEVELTLSEIDPESVQVELYADGVTAGGPVRQAMAPTRRLAGRSGPYVYRATVPTGRSPAEYTPRVMPRRDGVAVPLELDLILWQR